MFRFGESIRVYFAIYVDAVDGMYESSWELGLVESAIWVGYV